MFAIFYRLADTNFCASHQPLLSGSGLPSVAGSNCYASNGGFSSVRTQPFMFFSCAISPNSHLADSILLALSQTIA
jgi:hypothetical protein